MRTRPVPRGRIGAVEAPVSEGSLELAEIALEAAAQSVQSGATLHNKRDLDPLAREYLVAAADVTALREATYGTTD